MRKPKVAERVPLTFVMSEAARDQIQKLADVAHSGSMAATVRHALAVYSVLIEHRDDGGLLVLKFPDGTERLLTLAAMS